MSPEPFPTCRRKAVLSGASGLVLVLLAWVAGQQGWPLHDILRGLMAGVGVGLLFAAVLFWFSPDTSDAVSKRLMSRYHREMWPAMAAYVLVMLAWKRLLGLVDGTAGKVAIALLPALLVLWTMRAFVRYVRDSDEMQRRIELESGSIAGLLVSAAYLAAGFLQTAELIDIPSKVAMIWVFPLLCITYAVAKVITARRYQ